MKAYHFLKEDMTSGYGNEPAWQVGEERTIKGKLVMCGHGYHSSPSWYDALGYAPGNMACIVEVSGKILKDTDKQVSSKRKLIAAIDAEKVLRTWACDCAERALKKANVKDKRSWNAIKVARLYNEGKATKQELAAARGAARDARDAARGAAWAAWDARGAARDASDAARDAARGAAWAAYAAALATARANARAARAARDAAGDARDAARAARDKETQWQLKRLDKLMNELFKEVQ